MPDLKPEKVVELRAFLFTAVAGWAIVIRCECFLY